MSLACGIHLLNIVFILRNGAIIGTNALVTKDVPDYASVGGTPARVISMRFDDETIMWLLDIAWWDWSIDKILNNLDKLLTKELKDFE